MDRSSQAGDAAGKTTALRLTRRRAALVLSAGTAALFAACTSPAPPAQPSPAASKPAGDAAPKATAATQTKPAPAKRLATNINMASPILMDNLDPHGTLTVPTFQGLRPTFDGLVTFTDDGSKIVPLLASEWKRIDARTVEFKLRDNVKFSNGEDFNAEAVKFSIDRVMGSKQPIHASTKLRMGPLETAEVVNSTTVRIKTKNPDPILLNRLTMLFMVPPKYTRDGADLATKPVGTGPLKIADFQPGSRILYEAWDGSWRGRSAVQTAKIQKIAEPATMVAALRTGEVDIAYNVPPDQIAGLKRDGLNVGTVPAGTVTLVSVIAGNSPFDDPRFREAMNYAVDKDEILNTVLGGLGRVAQAQILQPGMLGYRDDLKVIPFDPDRAKRLFKEAGFEGKEFPIAVHAGQRRVVEAVVGYLNAVGVKARVDLVEVAVIAQALNQGTDRPAVAFDTNYFHIRDFESGALRFGPETKQQHFKNADFDKLWMQAKVEMDEAKRGQMIGQMAQIMRDNFAVLFTIWVDYATAYTKKIEKLDFPYDNSFKLWEIAKEA